MRFLFIFLLATASSSYAQDTVLLKDKSRLILNVLHVTNFDVVYTKPNKTRSYFLSFTEVKSIHYRDGSKQNIDSLYTIQQEEFISQAPAQETGSVIIVPERKRDIGMYNKGREDAREYYDYKQHFSSGLFRWGRSFNDANGHRSLDMGFNELNLNVPNREYLKSADYRAGYIFQAKKLKNRYDFITGAVFIGVLSTAVIMVALAS